MRCRGADRLVVVRAAHACAASLHRQAGQVGGQARTSLFQISLRDHQRPAAETETIDEMVSQALRDGEPDQRAQARLRYGEVADAEVPGQLGLVLDRPTGLESGGLVQAALFAKGVSQGHRQDDPPSTAQGGGENYSSSSSILSRAFRSVLVSRRLVICSQTIGQATDLMS